MRIQISVVGVTLILALLLAVFLGLAVYQGLNRQVYFSDCREVPSSPVYKDSKTVVYFFTQSSNRTITCNLHY